MKNSSCTNTANGIKITAYHATFVRSLCGLFRCVCVCVTGESGLGKSTLVNSLFLTDLHKDRKLLNAEGESPVSQRLCTCLPVSLIAVQTDDTCRGSRPC